MLAVNEGQQPRRTHADLSLKGVTLENIEASHCLLVGRLRLNGLILTQRIHLDGIFRRERREAGGKGKQWERITLVFVFEETWHYLKTLFKCMGPAKLHTGQEYRMFSIINLWRGWGFVRKTDQLQIK